MSHTKGCKIKDPTSLDYGINETPPIYDKELSTASDSKFEIQPIATTILGDEDFLPSTSII